MKKLLSKTFDNFKSVREHIMEMRDMFAQLKSLEVDISESFLVHFILNSLPSKYTHFKISYNTHKDKWSENELLTMCVQEGERLKHEKQERKQVVNQEIWQYGYLFLLQEKWAYEEGLPKISKMARKEM
jgi:hypothetical protein